MANLKLPTITVNILLYYCEYSASLRPFSFAIAIEALRSITAQEGRYTGGEMDPGLVTKRDLVRKNINSFNLLLFASVGSLLADAHVFFEPHKEIIASFGIAIGVTFSFLGAYLYYKQEAE